MSLPHSTSDQYFKKDGLFMRKFQLKNYKWVGQIILPTDIAIKMIKKYHAQPLTRHVSTKYMSRHLLNVFYIRNFTQLAQKIVNNCSFCAKNKTYPNKHIDPGLRIMISSPRQFLYMDICTIQSQCEMDSFFTILDGFSRFVLFIPIKKDCLA